MSFDKRFDYHKRAHSQARRITKIADQLLTGSKRAAKSDIRYWQAAVFQRVRNRPGNRQASKHFSVQLMAGGRREEFNLGVSNKAVPPPKPRAIYAHLTAHGAHPPLAL